MNEQDILYWDNLRFIFSQRYLKGSDNVKRIAVMAFLLHKK